MLNLNESVLMPAISNILIVSGAFYFIAGFLAFIEVDNKHALNKQKSSWPWVLFICFPICVIQMLYYFGFLDFIEITLDIFYINNIFTRNLIIIFCISISSLIVGLINTNYIQLKYSRVYLGIVFIFSGIYEFTHHLPYLSYYPIIHYNHVVSYIFSFSLSLTGVFYILSLYVKKFSQQKIWAALLMINGILNIVILPNHLHPFQFKQEEPFCFYQFTLTVFLVVMLVIIVISLINKFILSDRKYNS
jgi:hypothetical protein